MKAVKTLETILAEEPFFKGLATNHLKVIAGCASNVSFQAGDYVYREGHVARHFFIIRRGRVALELFAPGRGALTIQTLGEGDILGWSWIVPPYHQKRFDARAIEATRALAFDGDCLRRKFDIDPKLGYEMLKRFAVIITDRLQATRLQLLDLYGSHA